MRIALGLLLLAGCHRVTFPVSEEEAEACRRCLAQGRTWPRSNQCTANCDLQDGWCFRDSCPGPCSPENCGDCATEAQCQAVACRWRVAGEAMWCTARR